MIAALFVEKNGVYYGDDQVWPWSVEEDARNYTGPYPVVAHPPCNLWGKFALVNFKRWGGEHNRPGNDGGCFASALSSVRLYGGVLEHPAYSYAWDTYNLEKPTFGRWSQSTDKEWVTEVWQSAYGHKARKKTWLFYSGNNPPFHLRWEKKEGEFQIGFHDQRGKDRNKPTISGKKASSTPIEFRDELIKLAKNSNNKQTKA